MAIWNHDQDEPLMTRRKFFFLTGMAGAFAVAQSAGLIALVEHAAPERVWVPLWNMDMDSVLKEIYAPMIVRQLNQNHTLFKLRGMKHETTIASSEYQVPLERTKNTHRRWATRG